MKNLGLIFLLLAFGYSLNACGQTKKLKSDKKMENLIIGNWNMQSHTVDGIEKHNATDKATLTFEKNGNCKYEAKELNAQPEGNEGTWKLASDGKKLFINVEFYFEEMTYELEKLNANELVYSFKNNSGNLIRYTYQK